MCKKCEERARRGALSLLDSCEDKQGLPLTSRCDFCGMPTYRFVRKDGKCSERNRFGEVHKRTCAAVYSRTESSRVVSHPKNPRVHGYRPEDDQ